MAQAPIWPVATDAFIADTTGLSAEETGAYIMLLMCLWRNNGDPLPLDHKRLPRMARVSPTRWKHIWPSIKEFFIIEADLITQKRIQVDLEKVKAKINSNRIAGSLGGKAKSLKYKETGLADANNSPQQKDSKKLPIHEPYNEPKNTPPIIPPRGGKRGTRWNEDRLPEFWLTEARNKYPHWSAEFLEEAVGNFCDYWKGVSGAKGVKMDWQATFRNTCRMQNKQFQKPEDPELKNILGIIKRKNTA